jgi:hypothetical protein
LQTLQQQQYCWRFSELQVTIQCEAEPKWDFLPLSSTLLPLTKLQRFIWERKKKLLSESICLSTAFYMKWWNSENKIKKKNSLAAHGKENKVLSFAKREILSNSMEGKRDNERKEIKLHLELCVAVFRWKYFITKRGGA